MILFPFLPFAFGLVSLVACSSTPQSRVKQFAEKLIGDYVDASLGDVKLIVSQTAVLLCLTVCEA